MQGGVSRHADVAKQVAKAHGADTEIVETRSGGLVFDCDVLLIPGGESTTISRLLERGGVANEIRAYAEIGKPALAICAGLIIASRNAKDDRVTMLDLLDATADRNVFDQWVDSFETPLDVAGLDSPFPVVFIRVPFIDEVGESAEVLAEWDGNPVVVHDGPAVGTSFHPRLTPDNRLHGLAFFDELAAEIDARMAG